MPQLLIQFPIRKEKKDTWASLLKSELGLPYTKTMNGFISAEHGFSESDVGTVVWHLWEKWRYKEDYKNYMLKPPRAEGSKFMNTLIECLDGETSETWIELI